MFWYNLKSCSSWYYHIPFFSNGEAQVSVYGCKQVVVAQIEKNGVKQFGDIFSLNLRALKFNGINLNI